ncbi:MAG: RHS repeat protein [Deltaproteobacteria bacterium]|nr:RHS repeat protein [Deltaproteobacteria bacterium]
MKTKNRAKSIFGDWERCWNLVCSASTWVADETKLFMRDWKRNGLLVRIPAIVKRYALFLFLALGLMVNCVATPALASSYFFTDLGIFIPYGISGINIVGGYYDGANSHGFLYNGAGYYRLDFPGSIETMARGISGHNVVGEYYITNGYLPYHGFILNLSTNTYSGIDFPGAKETNLHGINGDNIVGDYVLEDPVTKNLSTHGFLYNGTYTTIDYPYSTPYTSGGTCAMGISGKNIVGFFNTYDPNTFAYSNTRGFFYDGSTYTTIDVPGASYTWAMGITGDTIVGQYYTDSHHGFIYNSTTHKFSTIDYPGALHTYPFGMSGNTIVGSYSNTETNGYANGFVASTTSLKDLGEPCPAAGNPINVGTGNKFQKETDYVGGASTHLTFRRYYNSQDTATTALGVNWHRSYSRYITSVGNTARVTRDDGRVDTFTKNSSGVWQSDPDVTSQLTALVDANNVLTGWQLVTPDDSTEIYKANGLLTSVATRAGLTTTLTRDAGNGLTTVTGPFGHTLSFSYNAAGYVSQVKTPDGNAISYAYDANNNLISVTYPGNAVRQYLYENTSLPNALTGIIDENGNRFATYAYDAQGRATSTQHADGAELTTLTYNTDGSTGVTDANGNSHSFNFITQFNRTKPTAASNASCGCGSSAYTYDANGFLSSRTDFNGNVTTYVRNTRGLDTSRTEASGTAQARTITTTWHDSFRLPLSITEPNRVTTFTYDPKGNLLTKTITAGSQPRTWTYTYNAVGQVLTAKDPLGHTTTYTYASTGGLATVTDALGHATSITSYDTNGRPLSITDPNGLVTTLAYDTRGRLTSRTSGGEITTYAYDAVGELMDIDLPDGSSLTYTYDAAHRLTGIDDALGNSIVYTLDGVGNRVKEQVSDSSNHLAQTRSHAYDALNRLAQDIGAQGQTTAYTYDNNGNLTGITDENGNRFAT